jgi:hypothetical protein
MKKKFSFYGFAICAATVLLNSCYPGPITEPYYVVESRQKENVYYVASTPNTQLLSEKNDLGFNLMRSGGSKFSGVECQVSYLPSKHLGLIAGYSSAGTDGRHDYMKYHQFETGIGYIAHLSKEWHFETYGGFGSGKINNTHATGSSSINLTHFFLQPAIVVSNKNKTTQFAFVSRFAGVNFKADTTFNNDREQFSVSHIKSLYDNPFHIMWEPGFVFRFGWQNFLFHTGYSFSADLTNSNLYRANSNFSIGASLRFNTSNKKSNQ